MKKSAMDGINEKMRRMTEGYGSASGPANNKLAPTNRDKMEGPEDAASFGADSAGMPKGRGDRAGRRNAITNPIPTYATGGAVQRARGGRAKKKGATNVNVIVAPQGGGGAPPMPMPPPMMAGPPPGGPPMPPKPPMGAGPMGMPPGAAGLPMAPGAPGGLPPGIVPPRKRGGRVHEDEAQDKALFKKMIKAEEAKERASGGSVNDDEPQRTLKNEGLVRERAAGGRLPNQKHHMTAGAVTGEGRLQKIGEKPKDAGKPQAV